MKPLREFHLLPTYDIIRIASHGAEIYNNLDVECNLYVIIIMECSFPSFVFFGRFGKQFLFNPLSFQRRCDFDDHKFSIRYSLFKATLSWNVYKFVESN